MDHNKTANLILVYDLKVDVVPGLIEHRVTRDYGDLQVMHNPSSHHDYILKMLSILFSSEAALGPWDLL